MKSIIRILRFFKHIILLCLKDVLYLMTYLVPRDRSLWIFGGWAGRKYSDNSRYLFEYINEHRKDIRAVWMAYDKSVYDAVSCKGYDVCYKFSLKGFWATARSSVAVICQTELVDLNFYALNSRTILIQLWHGIPLKKIGFDDEVFIKEQNFSPWSDGHKWKRKLFPFYSHKWHMAIAASGEDQARFSTAFNMPREDIKVTGYPRNDILIKGRSRGRKGEKGHKIVYMPTFRGAFYSGFDLFKNYGFDPVNIDRAFKEKDMTLYLKLHPLNSPSGKIYEDIKASDNIVLLDDDDIYGILGDMDILITDYSSVFFDYLVLDRPVIFAPFDMDDYIMNDRELYYDYNEVTPGPKAFNWPEVLEEVRKSIEDPGRSSGDRRKMRERFHRYTDDQSCSRVVDEIFNILKQARGPVNI